MRQGFDGQEVRHTPRVDGHNPILDFQGKRGSKHVIRDAVIFFTPKKRQDGRQAAERMGRITPLQDSILRERVTAAKHSIAKLHQLPPS